MWAILRIQEKQSCWQESFHLYFISAAWEIKWRIQLRQSNSKYRLLMQWEIGRRKTGFWADGGEAIDEKAKRRVSNAADLYQCRQPVCKWNNSERV